MLLRSASRPRRRERLIRKRRSRMTRRRLGPRSRLPKVRKLLESNSKLTSNRRSRTKSKYARIQRFSTLPSRRQLLRNLAHLLKPLLTTQ